MSFLDRLGHLFSRKPVASPVNLTPEQFRDMVLQEVAGLPAPSEHTALTVSAVYACVNLLAGAISALPMHIYRRQPNGDRERMESDELWWLLNEQFTPRWNAAAGWEFLVQSLLLQGDAFARIRRAGPRIVGLEPIHPSRVMVLPNQDASRLVYTVAPDPLLAMLGGAKRPTEVVDQDDMIHVPGFGFDGLRGLSPLRFALRSAAGVAISAQNYSGRFFTNSARPDVVIQTDQALTQEQADNLADSWTRKYGGSDNAHKPAVLGRGASIHPITMTAEDAQLLGTRQFQIEEIARIYGVPPFMIGHNEKTTSWGSGVEQMSIGFVRYALRQHLNKFHTEINRKFFRTASRCAEFDTTELERADTKSLFDAFRVALGRAGEPAFMTREEVRKRLNLPAQPVDGQLTEVPTNAQPPA